MPLPRIVCVPKFDSIEEELSARNQELEKAEEAFEMMEQELREKNTRIAVLEREVAVKNEEIFRYWHELIELIHRD